MSEPEDPEHLLAQALRAQATRAPHRDPGQPAEGTRTGGEATVEPPGAYSYGLLSGDDASSLEAENAALGPAEPDTVRHPAPRAAAGPVAMRWVLLLAVLLGLAAGAVVGVITLV
ncbi:hypothetical protein CFN78_19900 [Amycolatopsis antarctica]|uniref:Uncharacterized protein n=1 Tax=Amycolatopsis antarctica TaxID=1854586 RepID=A0A263CZ32_9PSEU|nr:hypothetical protein [Amycolatopsis antarctica]OZM71422.1 hypothetical protein CFN78_19900 [Amycolatopsis antarctica]